MVVAGERGCFMKRFIPQLGLVVLALVLPGWAWAQQQDDLDVTMRVVPSNASPGAAMSEIKLPDAASDQARTSSAFGQSVATKAHDMKGKLGPDFGQSGAEGA